MAQKKSYKETLNLPRTDFDMRARLLQKEPAVQERWRRQGLYERIRQARDGADRYILHDGPPYANGNIHMGTALNKVLKDMVVRVKNMTGYDAPYLPGWDCHGLPVEHQLLKELKIKKGELDQVKFREKAAEYAMKFVDIQKEEFKRLGVFGRWEKPYLTLDKGYEAEILRAFGRLVEKGYVYKDLKPVNWCTACETALAEAEVEYEDHASPSVYVKFKVREIQPDKLPAGVEVFNTYFLIWTTTPWTLMANVAIAVHPDFDYVIAQVDKEKWIVYEGLLEQTMKKAGKYYEVLGKVKGRDLEGSVAMHPFLDRLSRVVTANYVSPSDGTGCVHTAPGHGQEDYLTGKKYNLDLIMPVDEKGNFDMTCGEWSGMNVRDADERIIEKMREDKTLVHSEKIQHSYPHCWRCKKPIIFRATEQWFMRIDHEGLRGKLLEHIEKNVEWYPKAGMSRIKSMIENRPDWCLSRQRYWGVPIPVFYCKSCDHKILDAGIIARLADMVRKEGVDIWFKKEAAELLPEAFSCPKCKSSAILKENDILDVWFESGVSHHAVLKNEDSLGRPANLYLEGSDQHRGWFQSSIITGVAIDGIPPFKTVLTHGFIVDGEGRKMSKSMGNVISPAELMKKYGADILRLWVASTNYSDDVRISEEIMERTADAYRKIRNTFRYLLSNLNDFTPSRDNVTDVRQLMEIDRWMLSRLGYLVTEAAEHYADFAFHKVFRSVYNFCVYDVSSLYLDIGKDRLYTFKKNSPERRSVQSVLYRVLDSLVRVMSPILPFTTEEIWQESAVLKTAVSVHLAAWPSHREAKSWINDELDKKWVTLIAIRELVQKALEEKRAAGAIGGSLDARVVLYTTNGVMKDMFIRHIAQLPSFFIVSQVELADDPPEGALENPELGVSVQAAKAYGEKCQRCWHYSVTVGGNKEHPLICKKCVDNI